MTNTAYIVGEGITEDQIQKVYNLTGASSVKVVPYEALTITEGRYIDPRFDADGELVGVEGYTFSYQLKISDNGDGTAHSARGHASFKRGEVPGELKNYAHYLEGLNQASRLINPRHVFSKSGNGRLVCEDPNRSWYSLRYESGAYILVTGASENVVIDGQVRQRTPIESLIIARQGDVRKTISEKVSFSATVLQGWDEMPSAPSAPSSDQLLASAGSFEDEF